MENRRQDYRHDFAHDSGMQAALACQGPPWLRASGEILNLSVGGAALRLRGESTLPETGGNWLIRLSLPDEPSLAVNATLVHRKATELNPALGFRFLPLVDPTAQEKRERIIWRFLLDEQRKLRNAV